MADGSVIFDTKLDTTGIVRDLSSLASGSLKAAAAGLAALGAYAISVGSDFETAISAVAATMGKTTDQIADITAKAKELGATTAFSATQAAEGFNILAQSGLTMEQQLASIESVLGLAAAGEMQMSDAAGYLTTTVKAFSGSSREMNLSMKDTARLADLYAKGATLANTSTAQFGDAMTGAASIAGAYNQSIDTTGTLLLALAEKGYQGSAAGTYLGRAMADLYAPTANAQKALDALGVSAYDASGKQRDMIDVVGDLQQAFVGMTEEEQAAYTSTIFTTAGLKAFNSIAGNSEEELEALKSSLEDCTGAAERMAAIKLDNLQGDITILKSATEGFGIAIYENMQKPLRNFVQEATSIMDDLHTAIDEGGLSGLAGAVGNALSRAVNMIAQYAPELAKAAVNLVRSFVNGIAGAAPQLANVAVEIGTTLLGGLLNIGADLIRLGGELIIALANGITENMPMIVQTAVDGLTLLIQTFTEYSPLVIEAGIQLLTSLATGIIEALPTLIDVAVEAIMALAEGLLSNAGLLLDSATQIVAQIAESLPTIIQKIVAVLPQLVQTIAQSIVTLAPQIVQCGITLLTSLVSALPEIITAICGALPEIIDSIVTALIGMMPVLVECGIQLFLALIQALPEIIVGIVSAIPQIIAAIVQAIAGFIGNLVEAGSNLIHGLGEGILSAVGVAVEKASEVASNVLSSIIGFFGSMVEAGAELIEGVGEGISSALSSAVEKASEVASSVLDSITGFLGSMIDAGSELINSLGEGISSAVGTVVEKASEVASGIVESVSGFFGSMVEAGSNLLSGLGQGIANAVGGVIEQAKQVCSNIIGSIKGFFGIASPSKVFRDLIGKNLMLGLADGITENGQEAVEAAEEIAEDIADVDYDPKPEFDFDRNYDYGSLLAKASSAVQAARNITGKEISSGNAITGYSGSDDKPSFDEPASDHPEYIVNVIQIDGREAGRVITPYVAKQLEWDGK